MRKFALISILIFILTCLALVIHGCNVEEAQSNQDAANWLSFIAQHHCSVKRESTFTIAYDLWQCDGFTVKHQ